MIPRLNFGCVAAIVFVLCIWALICMAFVSPAFAASQDQRPYRGYVEIVIANEGHFYAGELSSRKLIDGRAACEAQMRRDINAYAAALHAHWPNAQVAAEYACRYEGFYV